MSPPDRLAQRVDTRLSFRAIHVLHGPNIWSNRPVLEVWVDLGELCETSSDSVPGFNERIMTWLPDMIEHHCSIGERGGFFERLRRGTYPAHILEHVCLELQSLAGTPVGYGKARGTTEETVYRVIISFVDEPLARAALVESRSLLLSAYDGQDFDVAAALDRIRAAASPAALDPVAHALTVAAKGRSIPVVPLNDRGLLQLGHGRRQRRVHGGASDRTSAVGEEIGDDRALHRPMLQSIGIPVPDWQRVQTADEAREAAAELPPPYIVKPLYRDDGPGISPPLDSPEAASQAFAAARAESRYVAVERLAPGSPHRILVLDGHVLAAVRLDPSDRTRGPTEDRTDSLHPETAAQAVAAAAMIGLDPASIDLVATDLSRPLAEQGGVVSSLLPRADLSAHLAPRCDQPRPVAEALIASLFPPGSDGRIPLAAIAGGPERLAVARLIALAARRAGLCTGLAWPGGVEVDGRTFPGRHYSAFEAARALIMHPRLELGALAVGRSDVLTHGLGVDHVTAGIVTGFDDNAPLPWANWGFDEPDTELPRAERCVLDIVQPDGLSILRADLPGAADLAELARGRVLVYASRADDPTLLDHREQGGAIAYADAGRAILRDPIAGDLILPFDPSHLPALYVLPALAALHALRIPAEPIRAAWATLDAANL
ncbi:MAG: cyanophycin synthetase [Isosphaeraceae bacterium]|jgi:cyanophycin synthetase|nr:MAG: cyanophycin synthetase [Isosphaeraceae bacterium]